MDRTAILLGNFRLVGVGGEGVEANHASTQVFETAILNPAEIPTQWKAYGRSIIFKDAEICNKETGVRSLRTIFYWRGFIHLDRSLVAGDPLLEHGWMISSINLDENGKPIFRYEHMKERVNLSGFYRYLVWD